VVEDDEPLRYALAALLAHAGYSVLTAESVHAALSVLQAPLQPVGALLLDIGLPDLSGADLCARIRQDWPGLPILVYTGAATAEEKTRLAGLGVLRILEKPVSPEDLLAAVRQALPAPGPISPPP
jgi:DNA-binding response OmpR family regulator